jgi:hypothetical protein
MSLSSEGNIPKEIKKPRLKFFSSTNGIKKLTDQEIELLKKRKRYIKNNKFVYLHPNSAAAKKLVEVNVKHTLILKYNLTVFRNLGNER